MFLSQTEMENDPRRLETKGLSRPGLHTQRAFGPMNLHTSLDRPRCRSSSCGPRPGPIQTSSGLGSPQPCHSAFSLADSMIGSEMTTHGSSHRTRYLLGTNQLRGRADFEQWPVAPAELLYADPGHIPHVPTSLMVNAPVIWLQCPLTNCRPRCPGASPKT